MLSANPGHIPEGAVSGTIHQAVGPESAPAARARGPIDPGNAEVNDAYNLGAKRVIHAVATVFEQQERNLYEVFLRIYKSVFAMLKVRWPRCI